jgi:hypothetical protein
VNTAATGDDAELDIALYVPTSRMAASAELACTAVAMGSGGHVTHFGLEERRLSVTRITARHKESCLLSPDLQFFLGRGVWQWIVRKRVEASTFAAGPVAVMRAVHQADVTAAATLGVELQDPLGAGFGGHLRTVAHSAKTRCDVGHSAQRAKAVERA